LKRERTNSQVLTVFFFGVGSLILQMEVDCLGYFHDVPPLIGFVDENSLKKLYIIGSKSGEATADLVRNKLH
jgi:hypothetical protein